MTDFKTNGDDRVRMEPRSYACTPANAIGDKRLNRTDLFVLMCHALHADPRGYSFPSQQTIIEYIGGGTRKTIQRVTAKLIGLGYLELIGELPRKHGHFGSLVYRVVRRRHARDGPYRGTSKNVSRSMGHFQPDHGTPIDVPQTNHRTDHTLNQTRRFASK